MGARRMLVGLVAAAVGVLGLLPATASAAEADTTPPVLTGVALSASTVRPGAPLDVLLDASDDVGVARAVVDLREIGSGQSETVETSLMPLVARFSPTVDWANGTWRVHAVVLSDAAGNTATYGYSGRLRTVPATATTHDVRMPTAALTGGLDRSPPELLSLTTRSTATRPGEPSTFAYEVRDAEAAVAILSFRWWNRDTGEQLSEAPILSSPPSSGTLVVRFPQAGRWSLQQVYVSDSLGNWGIYGTDSHIVRQFTDGLHTLRLAELGSSVTPGPQRVWATPHPDGFSVLREPDRWDDKAVITGFRVSVQPAGIVREVPYPDLPLRVRGLPIGVPQRVTVVAHSPWGDGPATTVTTRPVLSRWVTGALDVTGDRGSDVAAQPPPGMPGAPAPVVHPGAAGGSLRPSVTGLFPDAGQCDGISATSIDPDARMGRLLMCQNDVLDVFFRDGGGMRLGTRGWRVMRWVDGGFSLDADTYPDVIAVNPGGELLLYPKTSEDRLLKPTRIGTGWGSMLSVISAGDLTGDRRNDIVAVDAVGRLWLYSGNGRSGVTAGRQIGAGWDRMGSLLPLGDLDRDGRNDLGGITPTGDLLLYRGTGTGGVRGGVRIGTGWDRFL